MANKNKNATAHKTTKLKIKKGDQVVVTAGAYKDLDTPREILEVFPAKSRVIVDQVNIVKKHLKPTQDREGGIQEVPAPIHISNVMLVDPKTGEPTRVGRKRDDNGKLVRFSKKSGEIIK